MTVKIKDSPYIIIEVANCHGGDFNYIIELINKFKHYVNGYGIKFQAFHHDYIALKDFKDYDVYQKFNFSEEQWSKIISLANTTKDVWLDIFDLYGTKILKNNFDLVKGIKFQSSVLKNYEVISELTKINLSNHMLIINVAGYEIIEIEEILRNIKNLLNPKEILIEFGFQAYPTSLNDSGFNKLSFIKKHFENRIVFADHLDSKSEDSIWFPIVLAMSGVDVIEKHVMLDRNLTKYDYFSSLEPDQFSVLNDKLNEYTSLKDTTTFINENERQYLAKTLMKPFVKHLLKKGSHLNINTDIIYRRSSLESISIEVINQLQSDYKILRKDKDRNEPLKTNDFRSANIGTIVACRMKSSRLKNKAILKIGSLSSIETCLQSCLQFKNVNHFILATSNLNSDEILKDHTYSSSVKFRQGHPENVIKRYVDIIKEFKLDIIIRVTGDNPYVSHEVMELALKSHFKNAADYTAPVKFTLGSSVEIINASSLIKLLDLFPSAEYSEYMTWYFQNNKDFFNVNLFDLPNNLISNYRLTLDYEEDLKMFGEIERFFANTNQKKNLLNIIKFLDSNPKIANINKDISPVYKANRKLIKTLNKMTRIKN